MHDEHFRRQMIFFDDLFEYLDCRIDLGGRHRADDLPGHVLAVFHRKFRIEREEDVRFGQELPDGVHFVGNVRPCRLYVENQLEAVRASFVEH